MTDRLIPEPTPTDRGFLRADFKDANGKDASIQESSVATESMLWLGLNTEPGSTNPGRGSGRMHLNEQLIRELAALMICYADHGTLLAPQEPAAVGDLRDALAAANAHAEAQAERIAELQEEIVNWQERMGHVTAGHAADTERWTEQMAALGRDLGKVHQEYRQAADERDRLQDELDRLKAKLWDTSQVPAPWNEGSAT